MTVGEVAVVGEKELVLAVLLLAVVPLLLEVIVVVTALEQGIALVFLLVVPLPEVIVEAISQGSGALSFLSAVLLHGAVVGAAAVSQVEEFALLVS